MNIDVQREIFIPAPENPGDHSFYWTINPSYTSNDGTRMIMTACRWISNGDDHWRQRTNVIQRWESDDNGATWTPRGPAIASSSHASGGAQTLAWGHFLDASANRLLSIHQETRPNPNGGVVRTTLNYAISTDGGRMWGPSRQIICRGDGLDASCWMPGIDERHYVGVDQPKFARLDDGTIVFGVSRLRHEPRFPEEQLYGGVVFLRGTWSHDGTAMTWEAGDPIRVPSTVSSYGVDEPDLLHLGGQRLLTTMRCEGSMEPEGLFTTRQWAISEDGGRTWGPPRMLCYEDGSMVCVPAALSAFERHPLTGRVYWIANIQDRPVTGQMPRYPLTIAELDPERICIIKDSVTMIQDLPPGAPANRMYSNFGHYVDRISGEIVIMLAEKPKYNDRDYRADTIRFRLRTSDLSRDNNTLLAARNDPRHRWFNAARFGLFVHWGPYSALGRGEQVLFREHLDQRDYTSAACSWKPAQFDARAWASVAQDAGMKYAVFTTRHHDGFCMWDTRTTDYSSAAQAAKRDFVAEYVTAFRQAGLRVGLYYSLADWRIPAYWSDAHEDPAGWERFRTYVHQHVRELLSNYGVIDLLWFDGAWPHNAKRWQSEQLIATARELQPGIMINNRLDCVSPYEPSPYKMEAAGDSAELGDFGTPEHEIVADASRRLWESCQVSTWRLWGYASGERWRSADLLLDMLVESAGKGGNLLLNVGPDADGRLPQPFIDRAAQIGQWMRIHGEAIHDSEPGDVCEFVTRGRQTRHGNNLYLIIRFWDGQPTLRLAGLATPVTRATLLTTGQRLQFEQTNDEVIMRDLPAQAPTDLFPVIKLEFNSPPRPQPWAKDRLWSGDPRCMLEWARARGTSVWADSRERRQP